MTCPQWGPADGGEWFISDTVKNISEPDRDGACLACFMLYTWNQGGSVKNYKTLPNPGGSSLRFMCEVGDKLPCRRARGQAPPMQAHNKSALARFLRSGMRLDRLSSEGVPSIDDLSAADVPKSSRRSHMGNHGAPDLIGLYELEATDLGPACQDAYVEAMACLSTISCTEYLDENFGPDDGGECDDVLRPYFDLCPGVFFAPEAQQE